MPTTLTVPALRSSLALHAQLAVADRTRGVVWSPYSVASAVGLAAAGARGATYDEIARVLAPEGDPTAVAAALTAAAVMSPPRHAWEAVGQIAVVTTLWAAADLPITARYRALARSWPGGEVRPVDFAGDLKRARETINANIAQTTHGLIRDLLAPSLPTAQTRALLVNALWLKAAWRTAFAPGATRDLPFHAPSGTRAVATMHDEHRMLYAARAGWQVVSLAAGGDVLVDILLPDRDLAEAEAALDAPLLGDLIAAARGVEVKLWLPRFRVEGWWNSLKEALAALGIRMLFTAAADLSGVTDGAEPLMISAAVHKAMLTVDEAGLEGAAATAAVMVAFAPSDRSRPIPVHVDRPFLVLVRHQPTGAVYFMARVTEP